MLATLLLLAATARSAPPPDACHVLTKRDVASVQGETYTSTKLTPHGATTTCFYQLPTFTNSVSVDVTPTGGRAFWREHFESEHDDGDGAKHDGDRDRDASPPRKVTGVGNEAVWVSSRAAGSLYVRKGDALLRISVGGAGTEAEKIARSKRLAAMALKRM